MIKNASFKILLLILSLLVLILSGCGSSGSTDNSISDFIAKSEKILNKVPERIDVKNLVINKIITSKNQSPNKTEELSNYFILSKVGTEIENNFGLLEYEFLYIENYDLEQESRYSGIITYYFEYCLNDQNEYEWIENSAPSVTFQEILYGKISGKIVFLGEPLNDIYVYGENGEDRTLVTKTDINGNFIISDILLNTYKLKIYGDNFPEIETSEITVTEDQTTNIGTVELFPEENSNTACIFGKIFSDYERKNPVKNINVFLFDSNMNPVSNACRTDNRGEFVFNRVETGNYIIIAKSDLTQSNGQQITITENDYHKYIEIDSIYLINNSPVIENYEPSILTSLAIGDSTDIYIEATDADSDPLTYSWTIDSGNIEYYKNTARYTATETGMHKITVIADDGKGGTDSLTFEIKCGEIFNWEYISDITNFPAVKAQSITSLEDKVVMTGGIDNLGNSVSDIFHNSDGVYWVQTDSGNNYTDRAYHKTIFFNNTIIMIGGKYFDHISNTWKYRNDSWSSFDGINWTQIISENPFGKRIGFALKNFNEKLYLYGGIEENNGIETLRNDIWSSSDGINWNLERGTSAFSPGKDFDIIFFNDKYFLFGGNDGNEKNDIYQSTNGIDWELFAENSNLPPVSNYALAVIDDFLFIVTEDKCIYTRDCITWINSPVNIINISEAVTYYWKNRFFLCGGVNNLELSEKTYQGIFK